MAALQHILVLACLLASLHLATAGCAGEIFNCNGDKNPCTNKQCSSGMVCRVDNCRGCFAKCEPPGMVHIMSLPSAGPAMPSAGLATGPSTGSGSTTTTTNGGSSTPNTGSGNKASEPQCACPLILSPVCGSDGKQYANKCLAECAKVAVVPQKPDSNGKCPQASASSADNNKVVEEAGCKCPRNFMPVCGSDGKKYNNKCLAECAKVTVVQQQPDKDGKCPQGAYGNTSSKPQQNQPAGRPQGFTCRCAASYKPVCGTDGVFYDNECLAICEGVQISEVKPDMDAKKCNMKRN